MNSADGKIRFAVFGLGNRAGKYMEWIRRNPSLAEVFALVEPCEARMAAKATGFNVPVSRRFSSPESFFASACVSSVDAVIIATPDRSHSSIALQSVRAGLHILLEKPIATSLEECREICRAARDTGVTVAVCHELRCHPYYIELKRIVGSCGKILSMEHRLDVGPDRMTHTFVRGLWGRSDLSSPIVLSKCSHDIDLMLWLSGSNNVSGVTSAGSLGLFIPENAPGGSTLRCLDCPVEGVCRYSAVDLYRRRREWISGMTDIESELSSGPFGRCVFRCGNDVCDYQSVDFVISGDIPVSLVMDGRSDREGRHTVIRCSGAVVEADGRSITVTYADGTRETTDLSGLSSQPYHSGADFELMRRFALGLNGVDSLSGLLIEDAMTAHEICFAAEDYRNK